jgi:hypothetical protein
MTLGRRLDGYDRMTGIPDGGTIWHEGRKKGPTAWVRKAIAEHRKGKIGADVRNLGDVRWLATEDGSVGPGTGRHIAAFVLA